MKKDKKIPLKIADIKKIIEKKYKIDLSAKNRLRKTVYYRAIYFKLCKEYTHASYERMGSLVGRDHASAIHNIHKIFEHQIKYYEPEYYEIYEALCNKLDKKTNRVRKKVDPDTYYKEKYTKVLLEYRGLIHRHNFSLKELKRMGHKLTESKQLKTYI